MSAKLILGTFVIEGTLACHASETALMTVVLERRVVTSESDLLKLDMNCPSQFASRFAGGGQKRGKAVTNLAPSG